ncbi:hypothetical protein KFE25_011532 [Diacronema lutheri]|uniref:Mitochondrial import inner membrane translocase subunit TIM16 n=1 Tax=Diacronema lutheri TaxID=2081491 RepID=A0A8J6C4W6_DIALT|nr:hypothetical protein KFE25_011532 [Diacronema lutheri]
MSAFARLVANIMVMGGGVLGRAFLEAYKQALQNGGKASRAGLRGGGISVTEARSILDVKPNATAAEVEEAYARLHAMNAPANGGSSYLQSKIANARAALSAEAPAGSADGDKKSGGAK